MASGNNGRGLKGGIEAEKAMSIAAVQARSDPNLEGMIKAISELDKEKKPL